MTLDSALLLRTCFLLFSDMEALMITRRKSLKAIAATIAGLAPMGMAQAHQMALRATAAPQTQPLSGQLAAGATYRSSLQKVVHQVDFMTYRKVGRRPIVL